MISLTFYYASTQLSPCVIHSVLQVRGEAQFHDCVTVEPSVPVVAEDAALNPLGALYLLRLQLELDRRSQQRLPHCCPKAGY